MNRRSMLLSSGLVFLSPALALAAPAGKILKMFKNPSCGCCTGHAQYLRDHGYEVEISEAEDLDAMRVELGVPDDLAGCHLIRVDRYVIEGHVPVAAIDRLLAERPAIKGLAVPGMPPGSPGMSGDKSEPLVVLTIDSREIFLTE